MFDWMWEKLKTKQQAIEDGVCNLCGEPVLSFKDELSLKEYEISGLCGNCQDELFEPDPYTEESDGL